MWHVCITVMCTATCGMCVLQLCVLLHVACVYYSYVYCYMWHVCITVTCTSTCGMCVLQLCVLLHVTCVYYSYVYCYT
jgi:hypothetical protein